jgi:hypothetical protein
VVTFSKVNILKSHVLNIFEGNITSVKCVMLFHSGQPLENVFEACHYEKALSGYKNVTLLG